jgi:hypothetical protein
MYVAYKMQMYDTFLCIMYVLLDCTPGSDSLDVPNSRSRRGVKTESWEFYRQNVLYNNHTTIAA